MKSKIGETCTFSDSLIEMSVPDYLKLKKRHPRAVLQSWYFTADRRKCNKPAIEGLLVSFINDLLFNAIRLNLETLSVVDDEMSAVFQRILRRGYCQSLNNGFELLNETLLDHGRDKTFRYNVVFTTADQYIHIDMRGQGERENFEKICNTILYSLKFKFDH